MLIWFKTSVVCLSILWITSSPVDSTGADLLKKSQKQKSVIVIGAGVSGLITAVTLRKAGYNVTVLEALDSIGGRIQSKQFGKHYVELGAEWVLGQKGNSVYELMKPYDVFPSEDDAEENNETVYSNIYTNGENNETVVVNADNTENNETTQFADETYNETDLHTVTHIFATQKGEELDSKFNELMQNLMNSLNRDRHEANEEDDSFFNSTKLQFANYSRPESFGEFGTALFKLFNEKYPIHERETIREAALDWIHRNANIDDGSDNWFMSSNSDKGDQIEYCEGDDLEWEPPNVYSSLLLVILGYSPTDYKALDKHDWIKYDTAVSEIKYSVTNDELVTVTTTTGQTFKADHVVCTVSLGVLKHDHKTLFNPKLPEKKQLAIENIAFGTVNKIYLEFETEWWSEVDENFTGLNPLWEGESVGANVFPNSSEAHLAEEIDGIPVWCRSIEGFNLIASGSHPKALQVWISGVSARFIETLDLEDCIKNTMKMLRKFLGARFTNIPDPIGALRTSWFGNPYTRGSYSFRSLDSEKFDVWARDLAVPILNNNGKPIVLFAGEATHENYFSTVHGAYDSGVREANRIMKFKNTES